jgi:AraC-like DNA-binding protein
MAQTEQTEFLKRTIPVVNIGWIHPFLEILEEVGHSSEDFLRQAALPVLAAEDGSVLVPTEKIYRLVHLASKATRMPDLGFRAGNRIDIEPTLPSPEHYWSRPGVFRTLESFINVNLESTSHGDLWLESISDREKTIEFFYRGTFGRGNPAFPTVEQFMVALMVRFVRAAVGPGWNPRRVDLRANSVPQRAIEELVGEAEVRCAQTKTSLLFPSRRWVDRVEPFPEPDSVVWKRHRRWLENWKPGDDLAGSLRLVLKSYLPDGSPGIGLAAQLSGMTVRTLQRQLADQGTTYSRLLSELRHDLAIYLLRDSTRSVADVGRELGYRDPAIFTRAFRRWTGTTPSNFRSVLAVGRS